MPPGTVIDGGAPQAAGGIVPPIQPPAQPPGGGGQPPEDWLGALITTAIDALQARVAQAAGRRLLPRVWTDLDSYAEHVERRMLAGHVANAELLAERTFAVLAAARDTQVAFDPAGRWTSLKFQITPDGWIVILDARGRIVTSYPFDPDRPGFTEWNALRGIDTHDYTLTPAHRDLLARLFGRP